MEQHQPDSSHDNKNDDSNDKVLSTIVVATNNIHTTPATPPPPTTMVDHNTTTTNTADVSLEVMRWLLIGGDDDSSDHVLNTLLVSSLSSSSSSTLLNVQQQQQRQQQHPLSSLNSTNSDHNVLLYENNNKNKNNNTLLETVDSDHVINVNDDGNGIDDIFDDDTSRDIIDLEEEEEEDDDDISSVMSDVGLLDDIDFDYSNDDYPIVFFNSDDKEEVEVNDDTIHHSKHNKINCDNQEIDHDHHSKSTNEQEETSFIRKQEQEQEQQQRRHRFRDIHHHQKQQQQQQQQQVSILLKIQQQELQQKFQQRQIYLQQQEQSRHSGRLLQPIKEREYMSMTLQFNQLHKGSNVYRPFPIRTPPATNQQDGTNSFFRHIYDFIVFEYYLTIPASIAVLFHSIIMIAIYDLIHELVLYTYTDVLPTLYTYMVMGLSLLLLLPQPLPDPVVNSIAAYITPWLGTHYYYYAYYDNLFYMAMCIVGVYFIHLSGYLYWWLSDYDYTIMKYDTHNRIRLLQWIPTTRHPNQKENKNTHINNIIETSTNNDDGDNATAATSTTSSRKWTNKQQQQRHHSSSSLLSSTRITHDKNSNRQNFVNTFVLRFYKVRQYPILRLMLYMIGYFIIYMISQLIVSNTYPYFSQHETILPHLPSLTFDKQYYHLVDTHTINDSLLSSSSSSSSSSSISNRKDNVLFSCIVQTCRMEMERQQRANMELVLAERLYTKPRLAYMSYLGYWSTFVEQYGEKSIYPLFDTIRNRFYTVEDDDDEYEGEDDDVKETSDEETEDAPLRRKHTDTIVDFQSMPVFNNVGEIVFSVVSLTIGIVLLRGYGFIFWQKY